MSKKYVVQQMTDRCGRIFFPIDNDTAEDQREEYFDTYEEADKRLAELQKRGIYSMITEIPDD